MGNRFRALSGYRGIIIGHGIVAAITFLGVVPAAIFIARFDQANPPRALRLHIILQVLTVILTVVIFILGFIAVGPERSLTNPHHGIGTAIFVLILVQALAGALIHRIEKGKKRTHLPIRLMVSY
jgi:predicted small integral membrane protein